MDNIRRHIMNSRVSKRKNYEYFTIEALEDGLTANLSTNACEYRIDNGDWNTLSAGNNTTSINTGQTLSFRGNLTPNSSSGIGTFTISKKCNLKGNIMSLLYGEDFINKIDLSDKSYSFYNLFKNCANIVDASKLILPATTLAERCYYSMFYGCTSLTIAPELPATTLAKYCYYSMFQGCDSLTTAPELPATTLVDNCYEYMFTACKSLTAAPELPATTLSKRCYSSMFNGCTGLTAAPELTVTKLAQYCYYSMFSGCTSLTKAPELPATTLYSYCYSYMFSGCTSLTKAPELPATTLALAYNCYSRMFQGCTSLTKAPELPATTLVDNCYEYMFYGCTGLTTAPELPSTKLAKYCYDSMFYGCTGLTTAPSVLPATKLAKYCYSYMFRNCTSLTAAPEIPKITLLNNEYSGYIGSFKQMFYNCSKLNYIKALFTDDHENCLIDWVYGVSSTGTFVKNPDMTSLPTGTSGIPEGWTVQDAII